MVVNISGVKSFIVGEDLKTVVGGVSIENVKEIGSNLFELTSLWSGLNFDGVISGLLQRLFDVLNAASVEIITIGIVFCGMGMMLAPLLGSNSARWFGRALFIALVGSIWRSII